MLQLVSRIIETMVSLKEFKEFMNNSEESILILNDKEVKYANSTFLNTFKSKIKTLPD